jgi:hypothetical protein
MDALFTFPFDPIQTMFLIIVIIVFIALASRFWRSDGHDEHGEKVKGKQPVSQDEETEEEETEDDEMSETLTIHTTDQDSTDYDVKDSEAEYKRIKTEIDGGAKTIEIDNDLYVVNNIVAITYDDEE